MRLLKLQHGGELSLTKDLVDDIPPYAILSRTWGSDDEEVTFKDLAEDMGKTKAGFRKIRFCGEQAAHDDLQHFWVDTCCIDKSNSAELSEAINSMFRWYSNATKCYVYLSDVPKDHHGPIEQSKAWSWEFAFRESRWFTRGWTVQELVAPSSVEFFSSGCQRLGDKKSLEQQVQEIMGIAVRALRGDALSEFSVDERMSWIENRHTKHYENPMREPFSTVPFSRDPDFVDRPEIQAWIQDKCARPAARAALVGLGGLGKSQLAIQYSHDIRDKSPQTWVFWVHASTKVRFEEAYRAITERLELPGRHVPNVNIFQLVCNWLCNEANGRWSMILDNVDDIQVFYPKRYYQDSSTPLANYLPQSPNGSILFTSRSKDAAARLTGSYNNIKEIKAMDESQALQLLQNKLQDTSNKDDTANLLHALNYIALAITQAAVYINKRARMTVSGYLDEFHRNDRNKGNLLNLDAGDLRRDSSASSSVVVTWQMSFEHIREERPSAADLLSLMSFFNPQGIPESILRSQTRSMIKIDGEVDADSEFDNDIDLLLAFSLVSVAVDNDMCEMHDLVHFCTRVWLSTFSYVDGWRRKCLVLIAREFPTGEFENWAKCERLLPHVEPLYDHEPACEESLREWAQVLTNAAWYMWMNGDYKAAQGIAVKALNARERILGHSCTSTLVTVVVLERLLQAQGKYDEAEKMNRRALQGREKVLGKKHFDTLSSNYSLAYILHQRKQYNVASDHYQRAYDGYKIQLGPDHPTTIACFDHYSMMQQEKNESRSLGQALA
ncbi:heterokaryon incompatibility protein-domain-containing protein [Pseudomassariella vexata]|uniref:Heterokaryon incompatibility protein-domain-containing protein n=1 Tax=Pseudomassariella vexata TaxID=1141098 RepID=A0A1Y2DVQ6_9PEZI|nr:heterokaryon incompatibility protein-domain-containing protein [Pseudomassariella vexata]ORY63343.1 heterokaryon incompatibility protein-domain-containing protein [Pseudomassariella vexata]